MFYPKYFYNILYILALVNEDVILCLFDLQSKEEVQLSHHAHFKFILHAFCKILTKRFISSTKYNIMNVNSYNEDIFAFSFYKKYGANFTNVKIIINNKRLLFIILPLMLV
jgi:hypothetical protein